VGAPGIIVDRLPVPPA